MTLAAEMAKFEKKQAYLQVRMKQRWHYGRRNKKSEQGGRIRSFYSRPPLYPKSQEEPQSQGQES